MAPCDVACTCLRTVQTHCGVVNGCQGADITTQSASTRDVAAGSVTQSFRQRHHLIDRARLPQSCLGQYLVGWVARCGAAAVRLDVKEDFVTGCFFDLNVIQSGVQGAFTSKCNRSCTSTLDFHQRRALSASMSAASDAFDWSCPPFRTPSSRWSAAGAPGRLQDRQQGLARRRAGPLPATQPPLHGCRWDWAAGSVRACVRRWLWVARDLAVHGRVSMPRQIRACCELPCSPC